MKRLAIITLASLICSFSYGQKENPFIRKGNRLYDKGKFKEAEIDYRKAIEKAPVSAKSNYNLGSSLYRQENYEEAERSFQNAAAMMKPAEKKARAEALHNLGNSYLKAEKYGESVNAYKEAMRLNPDDNDTRYNLAYAMRKLEQQQQQQQKKATTARTTTITRISSNSKTSRISSRTRISNSSNSSRNRRFRSRMRNACWKR